MPDLILLDVHLTDIHGYEVLERLQGDSRTVDIPVVVLSADATTWQRRRFRNAGVYDYLSKPLDLQQPTRRHRPAPRGRRYPSRKVIANTRGANRPRRESRRLTRYGVIRERISSIHWSADFRARLQRPLDADRSRRRR
jgi:CheY-like chemotaxis protein